MGYNMQFENYNQFLLQEASTLSPKSNEPTNQMYTVRHRAVTHKKFTLLHQAVVYNPYPGMPNTQ